MPGLRSILIPLLLAGLALPALAQPADGPSDAERNIVRAFENSVRMPWEGERLFEWYGGAERADHKRWWIKDGYLPPGPDQPGGAPAGPPGGGPRRKPFDWLRKRGDHRPPPGYFFAPIERTGADPQEVFQFPPDILAQTRGPVLAPSSLMLRGMDPYLGPQAAGPRAIGLAHVAITDEGTVDTLGKTGRGHQYTLKPRHYQGGWMRVVIDDQLDLPVQVERYDRQGKLKTRSEYRSLSVIPHETKPWFKDRETSPPPMPLKRFDRPLMDRLFQAGIKPPELDPKGQPPASGFVLADRGILKDAPFFTLQAVLSDGINPVAIYAVRVPNDDRTAFRAAQDTAQRHLEGMLHHFDAPFEYRWNQNWLLLAAGEVEDDLLSTVLDFTERRLERARDALTPGPGGPPPGAPPDRRPPPEGDRPPPRG